MKFKRRGWDLEAIESKKKELLKISLENWISHFCEISNLEVELEFKRNADEILKDDSVLK